LIDWCLTQTLGVFCNCVPRKQDCM